MIIGIDLKLLEDKKFQFMIESIGSMNIYLKNALRNMIEENKKIIDENGIWIGDKNHKLQNPGFWKTRMESLLPALDYMKMHRFPCYLECYNIFQRYYSNASTTEFTLLDEKIKAWLSLGDTKTASEEIIKDRLEEIFGLIYDYKFFVERRMILYILKDWYSTMKPPSELKVGQSLDRYSVIGCALPSMKHFIEEDVIKTEESLFRPTISCSLFSEKSQLTYRNREVGFLYEISPKNVLSMSPFDSFSNYNYSYDSFEQRKYGHLVNDALNGYDAVYYDMYENTFWSSDGYYQGDINSKVMLNYDRTWKPVAPILPLELLENNVESYNEIRLANIEKPYGIFCKESVIEERKFELQAASFLYSLPVYSLGSVIERIL